MDTQTFRIAWLTRRQLLQHPIDPLQIVVRQRESKDKRILIAWIGEVEDLRRMSLWFG